jgi:hypothetical protein
MIKPIEWAPGCLSLEEVVMVSGHKILMEVDNISLIVLQSMRGFRHAAQASPKSHINIIFIISI